MREFNWEQTLMGNSVLQGKDFYISYNSNPGQNISLFRSDGGGDETALCTNDGEYRILNGDFREEYRNIVGGGLNKCLEFYNSKKEELKSSWSTK